MKLPVSKFPVCWLRRSCAAFVVLLAIAGVPVVQAAQTLDIEIDGVRGELLDNVRAHLGLSRFVPEPGGLPVPLLGGKSVAELPAEQEIRSIHRRANEEIRAALQPYGYYDPEITSELTRDGERWTARYRIEPGEPVLIDSVQVAATGEGRDEPALTGLLQKNPLHAGERLQHPVYDEYRAKLLQAALDEGYLDARYTRSELRVNPVQHRAGVLLQLDTGPRYYFGPVTIEQDILLPAFIERFVTFPPGTPFDTAKLLKLQLDLGDTGYFDSVELEVQRERTLDQRVPVLVRTTPAAHTRYKLGLGYGTDTGPRVSIGADYRRLNRRGHGLSSDLRVSPIEQTAALRYTIPIRNLVTDRLVFGGELNNTTDVANGGESRSYKVGVSQNVNLGSMQRNLYLNYLHESFVLGNDEDSVDFLLPGASFSRLKSDSVMFPRRGYSWNVDLHGAPGIVSSTRFVRVDAGVRGVYPLGARTRLLGRTRVGATTVADFSRLPASERFFAGGDQSVRGYDYQSLAPRDSSGEVVGGQYLTVASMEVDHLFAGNFGAAVFVDAGNADDVFPPAFKLGAGIGFRWRSPIGMLRVDLAHPFDDPENSFRLHISIGPDL